jgi:hypothetical protein
MITPSYLATATERVLPKLALDFTTASLDPRVTFTRAGNTATVVNSSGFIAPINADLPRFDYDPVTLVCKGLLIEEARTNILTYSNDFRDTATAGSTRLWSWGVVTVTAAAAVSPDSTTNASKLISTAVSGFHSLQISSGTRTASIAYTFTFYAKAAEIGFCYPNFTSGLTGTQIGGLVNLSTGATSGVSAGLMLTTLNFGNGWWKITATATGSAATTAFNCTINTTNSSGTLNHTGNGVDGIYIYGAQLEAGAFATSYIPTTTTSLIRNADVATMTGANFSDWWQVGAGGAQVQVLPSTVSGIRPLIQFNDGTSNEIIALRGNTTNPELQIVDGGTPQAQIDAGTIAANTPYSLTGWWDTNDCKARKDLGAVVTDTTATIPTVTQMRIGSDGTNYLNGTLATIDYYNTFFGQPIYTRRKNKVFPSLF